MRKLALFLLFTCAWEIAHAQVNYIQNPGFEDFTVCPDDVNQINHAQFWSCAVDTTGEPWIAPEYFNKCAVGNLHSGLPDNVAFYQNAHTGNGMIGGLFYYDKTPPPAPGVPFNFRDYAQGHLIKNLQAGKTYCLTFWVNMAEASGYAQNKLGAYLDDGSINIHPDTPGTEITTVTPQVYTNSIISDTAIWTKIEGSFFATGNETHITLGNFFKNAMVSTISSPFGSYDQYSYYLIDDVSVIETDLKADAGVDTWVEVSKSVQIGRVGDTTVSGLDCKWFHKGMLIDSGAIINVYSAASKGVVDTYVVMQTICGNVKTDTVLVTTVGLDLQNVSLQNSFTVYPNPSDGNILITSTAKLPKAITATVYDLLGRIIMKQKLTFSGNQSSLKINTSIGTYILELADNEGNVHRERISIQ